MKKRNIYPFALAVIFGITGVVVGGIGVGGYLQADRLRHLSQLHSMIMMAAGGGGEIIAVGIGLFSYFKNRRKEGIFSTHLAEEPETSGLVYGFDAWKELNVEILDPISFPPLFDWEKEDPFFHQPYRENYVLLYIPKAIRFHQNEKKLTLITMDEITQSYNYFYDPVKKEYGDKNSSGWVLVSKTVIPESRGKDYKAQKNMVEKIAGFRLPFSLEIATLTLMERAISGNQLYGNDPLTYSRCEERIPGLFHDHPVAVGGFGFQGLDITSGISDSEACGVAAVYFFNS